jgi:hypothetical protein
MPARNRIATLVLLSSTAAFASPAKHTPPDDDTVKPELLTLRRELYNMEYEDAAKQLPRFRALCDADGYPLVGNIASKGDGRRMQPSEACRALRTSTKSSS